tara:strand:- start:7799 stop:8767 length:969 start_codon:yes stop_codon:yes gene_type:complete
MSRDAVVEHKLLMTFLADKHRLIADVIGNNKVSYIDVPLYRNVGDLLIMQGALRFFERYEIKVNYKANWFNVASSCISEDDVVVFQGGGNLGDLYGGCQAIREELIPKLTKQRVVILPQSIHFESEVNYQRCCELFRQHPDLHVFVRDQPSFELAQNMTKNVYLMPDMAHQLYPIIRRSKPERKLLALMRIDKEALQDRSEQQADRVTDWNVLFNNSNKVLILTMRVLRLSAMLGVNRLPGSLGTSLGILMANTLVSRAIRLFSDYQYVVTDRLHGHILSCLLDIPHQVIDNSYGKNSRYIALWTGSSDIVKTSFTERLTSD